MSVSFPSLSSWPQYTAIPPAADFKGRVSDRRTRRMVSGKWILVAMVWYVDGMMKTVDPAFKHDEVVTHGLTCEQEKLSSMFVLRIFLTQNNIDMT